MTKNLLKLLALSTCAGAFFSTCQEEQEYLVLDQRKVDDLKTTHYEIYLNTDDNPLTAEKIAIKHIDNKELSKTGSLAQHQDILFDAVGYGCRITEKELKKLGYTLVPYQQEPHYQLPKNSVIIRRTHNGFNMVEMKTYQRED